MARLVYKLVGQKKSDESEKGYYAESLANGQKLPFKPMNVSRALPRFFRIREMDEKTGKTKVKQIAYAPSENTIYVEDFIDPKAKIEKIKFKKGFLFVDSEREPQKQEFLDKIPYNAESPIRTDRDPIKFMRIDNEAKANEILKKEETIARELNVFWELPMEKRRAIANAVSINTFRDHSLWAYDLYEWARRNVGEFKKKYHDPDIDYIDMISRAEILGILKWGDNTWFYNDVAVMKISTAKNRYTEFVGKLINEPQLENAIANDVAVKEGKSARTIGEQQEEIDFSEVDSSALLKLAKEKGVVKYNAGIGHEVVVTGHKFGDKSVISAEKAIEESDLLREQIIVQLGRV